MNFPDLSKCKIAIIGLGYVGLPLAIEFATQKKCLRNNSKLKREVIGFDINHERIKELQKGIDKTKEISGEKLLDINNLFFTNDQSKLISADVFIVTVPTPIDIEKNPELSALKAASNTVGIAIKERYLSNISTLPIVIFESTVFPSATQEICQPIIAAQSGCNLYPEISDTGSFGIGYSPERINPGDKKRPLTKITKVTSGSCEKVADWIDELYGSIIESGTFKANSIMVAEASKIIENTQRDLNIALINELAIIFSKLGIDTLDVIKTASTKWNFYLLSQDLLEDIVLELTHII